ncbi:MAG: acyltransferase family protein [Actinomycetota bacterium]|nr:acyltransferase family protein [Actinomycetota bacterium]
MLLYHGDVDWARGGFLGVDAFFVLSGCLITTLLLLEWRSTGGIKLGAFWARRARRLLPALFLVLGAVAVYAATWAPRDTLDSLRGDALSALGYAANWWFIASGQSYFAQFALPSPLRHLWSLAIEEQFYVVWPLIFVGLLHGSRGSRRALVTATLILALGSFILTLVLYEPGSDPSRVYYGTDTRACSILIGALLALLLAGRKVPDARSVRLALHGAGIVAALALLVLWARTPDDAEWLYRGGLPGAAVLVAIVLASVSGRDPGPLGRLLAVWPFRWIGLISYGLYLWHWPVYVALNEQSVGTSGATLLAVRLAFTFALATASFYLVEQPIRRGAWRGWRIRVTAPVVTGSIAVALLLVTANATAPLRGVTTTASAVPRTRVVVTGDVGAVAMSAQLRSYRGSLRVQPAVVRRCGLGELAHSLMYFGTNGDDHTCAGRDRTRWLTGVAAAHPDLVVLFFGHEPFMVPIGNEVASDPSESNQRLALQRLEADIGALARHGAHVVVVGTPFSMGPAMSMSGADAVRAAGWNQRWNDFLREAVTRRPRVAAMLDPEGHVNEGNWVVSWLAPELAHRGVSWARPAGTTITTLVVGDSTALSLAPGLTRVADARELFVLNRARFNCGTVPGQIGEGYWFDPPDDCTFERAWANDVARYRPQLVIGYWGWVDLWDHRIGGRILQFGTDAVDAAYLQRLELAVATLTADGAHLVLVTSPYFDRANAVLHTAIERTPFAPSRVDHWNDLLRTVASHHPDTVTLIDLHSYQSPGGKYTDTLAGIRMTDDGVHYTDAGADLVARWLVPQLRAALPLR